MTLVKAFKSRALDREITYVASSRVVAERVLSLLGEIIVPSLRVL